MLTVDARDSCYCRVCNVKATGLHYDVRTCDACAVFFRRSIREKRRYDCEYNRKCSIIYSAQNVRKFCKYCRLEKCLSAGMRLNGIRQLNSGNDHYPSAGLSPSVYCKPRDELTYLDKLKIKRRFINSFRYHHYLPRSDQSACTSADMMYLNNQLPDFKNHQMMTVSESKLIDDFLFENDFYHTISIDDKVRLMHEYHLVWHSTEHAKVTVHYGGVERNCAYFLDGTYLSLEQESFRKYYANSGMIHDPDMMARLSLSCYEYHTKTVSRAFQTANLDETEFVAFLALLYITNYNSVTTVAARQALLLARKCILTELWQHYQSVGRHDPSINLASLIFLIDPIQTCATNAKEFVYAMHMGAKRMLPLNLGKTLNLS